MADKIFATLTPSNPIAKLAFSDLYGDLRSLPQHRLTENAQAALSRMAVEPNQIFDGEVLRLRRQAARRLDNTESDSQLSDSTTEPGADTDQSDQHLGMIWVGRYLLTLSSAPSVAERGWTMGRAPSENTPIELLLCTKFYAKQFEITIRNPHAGIKFYPDNGGLYVVDYSRSMSAQVTVNGEPATRRGLHLNHFSMNVQVDKLGYNFQWAQYADTDEFKEERRDYVLGSLDGPPDRIIDMPTPSPNHRAMGEWTLGEPLGKGLYGRVFFGSDSKGNVAAIKLVERTPKNYRVIEGEVETILKLMDLAKVSDDSDRLLRMVDVIYSGEKNFTSAVPFDQVAMVLKPLTPLTVFDLVRRVRSSVRSDGMQMHLAFAFRTALEGVKVLHDASWVHRDLKPGNIGILGEPYRAVLLDLGSSKKIPESGSLPSRPGTIGTVFYVAPELEFSAKNTYNRSIDIWSMGIILFELTYGYHPWLLAGNPFRADCPPNLKAAFRTRYNAAVNKMTNDSKGPPTDGHIHLGTLFVKMTKHEAADRPSIDEVLADPAWGPLLPDIAQVKRRRGE